MAEKRKPSVIARATKMARELRTLSCELVGLMLVLPSLVSAITVVVHAVKAALH